MVSVDRIQVAMKNIEVILQNDGIADISEWFAGAFIHRSLICERSDNRENREVSVTHALFAANRTHKNNKDWMDTGEDIDAGETTQHQQKFLAADKDGMSPVILQKKRTLEFCKWLQRTLTMTRWIRGMI